MSLSAVFKSPQPAAFQCSDLIVIMIGYYHNSNRELSLLLLCSLHTYLKESTPSASTVVVSSPTTSSSRKGRSAVKTAITITLLLKDRHTQDCTPLSGKTKAVLRRSR